ncbi:MAG TPA: hypothetical protein VF574_13315 [Allosphingosinicella sp.]
MINYIAIALAMLLLTAEHPPLAAGSQDNCADALPDTEAAATSHHLTISDWKFFRQVARARLKRGLEALPGMIGCPGVTEAAKDLREDRWTLTQLKRAHRSAEDYVKIGWAILVASDPEFFGLTTNPTVAANSRFLGGRRAEARALLEAR